jgi:hypothetical protein
MGISEIPRNKAKRPTQTSSNAPLTDRYCWEAQKPSRISSHISPKLGVVDLGDL